jgi:hypothetical protein
VLQRASAIQRNHLQLYIGDARLGAGPEMTIEEKFSCGINSIPPVQSHFQKYFRSRPPQITSRSFAIPSRKSNCAE